MKIIITGSEGLIGKELVNHLQKNHQILKLDLSLGHDLTDEKFVKSWLKKNKANSLINCFAMNDHVDNKRKKQTQIPIHAVNPKVPVSTASCMKLLCIP